MLEFDSLNPYQGLVVISGDNPEDLVKKIKGIRTPIKIVAIVANGTRHVAYIIGDHRMKKQKIKED